jgi:alkanesulfonate monooxygenase SsuD/methylene tetrahydromethanopterin reductase-like flavin-dependent oxidoreductase (luciferase family)
MTSSPTITTLAFLTPGNYPDDDPAQGLDETLALFEHAERLGFDGGWVRQRHLEHGVSSGAVFLAAAAQRTHRIELGTAVIPIGYENPFRLAEDLATADVLSHGRLQPGFSAGTPPHAELIGHLVHDTDWRQLDLSHRRVERLIEHLRGEYLGDPDTIIHSPGNVQRPRVQPHSPGLADRVWYGAGSLSSVRWAGSVGVNLLLGNVSLAEQTTDFAASQVQQTATFREALPAGRSPRIAIGRVLVPTDSADRTARARYAEYQASRHERTLRPQRLGNRDILFAPDLVGPADEIVERLAADAAVSGLTELRAELPYEFAVEDYRQILHDIATRVAPQLGWRPVRPAA